MHITTKEELKSYWKTVFKVYGIDKGNAEVYANAVVEKGELETESDFRDFFKSELHLDDNKVVQSMKTATKKIVNETKNEIKNANDDYGDEGDKGDKGSPNASD